MDKAIEKAIRMRSSNRVTDDVGKRILTINSGSSSIKLSLYHMGPAETLLLSGIIRNIGQDDGFFSVTRSDGAGPFERYFDIPDHDAALRIFFEWFDHGPEYKDLNAVGHRIVHGGERYVRPEIVDDRLLQALNALVPLAPDHLPQEIKAISEFSRLHPDVMQVACFDTAFHRSMPDVAQLYALPEDVRRQGVLRYGFHGLSYEYILSELNRVAGAEIANGRVIIAHLGNGASMGAFRNGNSVDTTMGFTPAGGLVMSTRSGDLDPGVLVYLLREKGFDASALNRLVNKQAGLLGASGTSSSMKELLDKEQSDARAAGAVGLFCYQAKKFVGALAAVLGGLDTLVFTGGIGENSPVVRERICKDLEFLGIDVDRERNLKNSSIISRDRRPVAVRVMKTNEELMIARHTYALIMRGENSHGQH
jgi:acetate kinase